MSLNQKEKVRYLMKKTLKIIGITLAVIAAIVILVFEVAAFDDYINSKVDRVQTAVQAPPTSITIPTNLGYSASTYCIELTATPDEFVDYFENVLAKDTINQNMIQVNALEMIREKSNGPLFITITNPCNEQRIYKINLASSLLGAFLLISNYL